jgi:hypothetical protein
LEQDRNANPSYRRWYSSGQLPSFSSHKLSFKHNPNPFHEEKLSLRSIVAPLDHSPYNLRINHPLIAEEFNCSSYVTKLVSGRPNSGKKFQMF